MDYYALYKVFKKSGPGPKNGEQYGTPFNEQEWTADDYIVDFNNNIIDQEDPNVVPENGSALHPLLDDEINDIIREILDDELVLDQQHVNGYLDFPQGIKIIVDVVGDKLASDMTAKICEKLLYVVALDL
ncbi:NAC domain-containing protein [Vigna angularis]|uniref:NAC domain-containing protein n=1 Tax=Phaseolus angularis TaxID=3914 RepID=A0A8T0JWN5_PHAAN|nr:NAC domain-containing protein [Vigna angularis]